jgi:hypothetical protein
MSAATAEKKTAPAMSRTASEVVEFPSKNSPAETPADLIGEARLGAERLARMSHDEIRGEISRRVEMLDTVLKEREERRAAIEEAMVAQRVLDLRRARARRIRRRVNIGSSLVAAMFTGLVVVGMF